MSSVVEKMLRDLGINLDAPKTEAPKENVPPTKTEGFDSLVSDEEFKAIKGVIEAFDKFVEVHNKNSISMVTTIQNASPYARVQYTLLSDVTRDMQDYLTMFYGIHAVNKRMLDEDVEESGCKSIEEYEHKLMKDLMLKRILK